MLRGLPTLISMFRVAAETGEEGLTLILNTVITAHCGSKIC